MTYLEIFFQVMQIMHLVIVIWKGVRKVVVIILCLHQTLLITSKLETRVSNFYNYFLSKIMCPLRILLGIDLRVCSS